MFLQNEVDASGVQAATSAGTANLFATKAKRQEHRAENPFLTGLPRQKLVEAVPAKSVRRNGRSVKYRFWRRAIF